jgi:hypothetical protein
MGESIIIQTSFSPELFWIQNMLMEYHKIKIGEYEYCIRKLYMKLIRHFGEMITSETRRRKNDSTVSLKERGCEGDE